MHWDTIERQLSVKQLNQGLDLQTTRHKSAPGNRNQIDPSNAQAAQQPAPGSVLVIAQTIAQKLPMYSTVHISSLHAQMSDRRLLAEVNALSK